MAGAGSPARRRRRSRPPPGGSGCESDENGKARSRPDPEWFAIAKGGGAATESDRDHAPFRRSFLFHGWPFDFRAPFHSVPNGAHSAADGSLAFDSAGIVFDREGGELVRDRLRGAAGFSVAAEVETTRTRQGGPARIVSLSADEFHRNFTLGQERERLDFRLRTPSTGANGALPDLSGAAALRAGRRQLLVATRDGARLRLYVDGHPAGEAPLERVPTGGCSADFPPVFGNEATGTRPWTGRLHDVAIYAAALPPDRVAGLDPATAAPDRIYSLRERCLARPAEPAAASGGTRLGRCEISARLEVTHLSGLLGITSRHPSDYLQTLLVWRPIGALLRGAIVASSGTALRALAVWATLLESLQLLLPARSSSILDLAAALAAGGAGCLAGRVIRGAAARRRGR